MKMNKVLKGYLLGVVTMGLVFSMSISGFAGTTLKSISAQIDSSVKILVNGKSVTLKDDAGAVVKPILYKDTYYVPVKSISEASGLVYSWDKQKKVIQLGERSEYVYVDATMYKDFYGTMFTKDAAKAVFGDKTFKTAIVNSMPLTFSDSFFADVILNKKYTTFTTTICLSEKAAKEQIFKFEDKTTKEVLKSVTLQPGETMDVTFSVAGITELRVACDANQGGADAIVIGEPRMK